MTIYVKSMLVLHCFGDIQPKQCKGINLFSQISTVNFFLDKYHEADDLQKKVCFYCITTSICLTPVNYLSKKFEAKLNIVINP